MKKKSKVEVKKIPTKNYFIVLIVSVLVVVLTLYVRSFYLSYQANNSDISVFEQNNNQVSIEDIEYAVNETTEGFLFVSYTGDTMVNIMERKLYKEIENKNLNDKVLYLNVTEDTEASLNILKEKFPAFKANMNKAPILIYIKDGKFVEAFDSSKEMISYKTLNTLLSKYGIE